MKFNTSKYGVVHYDKEDIITMPNGPLGFPECREFILLERKVKIPYTANNWMHTCDVLQSICNMQLSFVMVDPIEVDPDFEKFEGTVFNGPVLSWSDSHTQVYAICTVSNDAMSNTANLLGPIYYHKVRQLMHQIVLKDTDYIVNTPIFKGEA